jgi:8-oxo-dGTP diphosphatase
LLRTEPETGLMAWDDVPVFGHAPAQAHAVVRPSAYGLCENERRQLAVVRTPQGYFLPGGGMHSGETPGDAVIRELQEECGLLVRLGVWTVRAIDFVYSPTEAEHFEKHSTFIEAHLQRSGLEPMETDHKLLWLDPQQAVAHLLHPSHRWAAVQWEARRRGR